MEDILPDLGKGALLAQNPKDFENIPELDETDREIIRRETTRQWRPYSAGAWTKIIIR